MNKLHKILFTFIVGSIGGLLFSIIGIPVPWLLGPLTFLLIGSSLKPDLFYWPKTYKSVGMVLIGYTIGLALDGDAVKEIGRQLPYMFGMTMLLILLSAGIAWIVAKISKINYATALLSSIPGGMTQVMVMAEETKGVNLTIVTVTQTIRLMMIVIGMPLVLTFLGADTTGGAVEDVASSFSWQTILILAICVAASFIGKKIKFPTAFLLVPALVTALAQGVGMEATELPSSVLQFAQLVIGIHIGLMMKPKELENKGTTISLAIISAALLFIVAMGLGLIFAQLNDLDLPTALLSLAPGGMDQMGAIAHAVDAELSLVAGYQVFRAFFILFLIQPLLAYFLKRMNK